MIKKYLLVGGTRDGEYYESTLTRPPLTVYMMKIITLEEANRLRINDQVAYRYPDEVYALNEDGKYYFERTLSYFPGDYK